MPSGLKAIERGLGVGRCVVDPAAGIEDQGSYHGRFRVCEQSAALACIADRLIGGLVRLDNPVAVQ
jgi:hypothetical protein